MDDIAIRLKNVSKFYKLYDSPADRLKEALSPFGKEYHKKFYALKDINLEIKKGELLGIVGRNGCGKSTLLKIISSVLTSDSGQVMVRGKVSALLELGSGFNPEFTGLQNVYFYSEVLGLGREEIDRILDDILSFAGLGEYINQPLKTYSSGMKARLGFSVATAIQPEILILDEVLSVGDAQFRRKSVARMQALMNSGCTVLLVSHSEDSINRLCTKAIYIRDGEIAISGTPKNVTKLYLKVLGSNSFISHDDLRAQIKKIECDGEDDLSSVIPEELAEKPCNDESFFSDLVKKTAQPVMLNNFPVELLSAEIINVNNQSVNVLQYGGVYKLVLKYLFREEAENLVLPIAVYSTHGQLLTGIRNPGRGGKLDVKSDSVLEVTYDFECIFLPGMFYISTGVTQILGEEKDYLLRADDVLSFKVQDHGKEEHWGLFSSLVRKMDYSITTEQ